MPLLLLKMRRKVGLPLSVTTDPAAGSCTDDVAARTWAPEELWNEVCNTVQETMTKTISKKMKWKKSKWLSVEALEIV